MKPTLCFGEIMARFSPPGHLRLAQAMPGTLEITFAGAEANVAVALAQLGGRAEFISALPRDPIGGAALAALRARDVGVGRVQLCDHGRCGLYFVENGANQRGGLVHYDRAGSSFALTPAATYSWAEAVTDAGWLHTTGISAGVSAAAAAATLGAVRAARQARLTVSCDLNHRRKLWRWDRNVPPETLAWRTMTEIVQEVDVLMGNPFDLAALVDEPAPANGADDPGWQEILVRKVTSRFPHLHTLAMTLRQNHSASHHGWGSLLYRPKDGRVFRAPLRAGAYEPYLIHALVDRVGTGDVFAGALIFALQTEELAEPGRALAFATAASCLAHSIQGDFFHGSRAEVEALMHGDGAGHVAR